MAEEEGYHGDRVVVALGGFPPRVGTAASVEGGLREGDCPAVLFPWDGLPDPQGLRACLRLTWEEGQIRRQRCRINPRILLQLGNYPVSDIVQHWLNSTPENAVYSAEGHMPRPDASSQASSSHQQLAQHPGNLAEKGNNGAPQHEVANSSLEQQRTQMSHPKFPEAVDAARTADQYAAFEGDYQQSRQRLVSTMSGGNPSSGFQHVSYPDVGAYPVQQHPYKSLAPAGDLHYGPYSNKGSKLYIVDGRKRMEDYGAGTDGADVYPSGPPRGLEWTLPKSFLPSVTSTSDSRHPSLVSQATARSGPVLHKGANLQGFFVPASHLAWAKAAGSRSSEDFPWPQQRGSLVPRTLVQGGGLPGVTAQPLPTTFAVVSSRRESLPQYSEFRAPVQPLARRPVAPSSSGTFAVPRYLTMQRKPDPPGYEVLTTPRPALPPFQQAYAAQPRASGRIQPLRPQAQLPPGVVRAAASNKALGAAVPGAVYGTYGDLSVPRPSLPREQAGHYGWPYPLQPRPGSSAMFGALVEGERGPLHGQGGRLTDPCYDVRGGANTGAYTCDAPASAQMLGSGPLHAKGLQTDQQPLLKSLPYDVRGAPASVQPYQQDFSAVRSAGEVYDPNLYPCSATPLPPLPGLLIASTGAYKDVLDTGAKPQKDYTTDYTQLQNSPTVFHETSQLLGETLRMVTDSSVGHCGGYPYQENQTHLPGVPEVQECNQMVHYAAQTGTVDLSKAHGGASFADGSMTQIPQASHVMGSAVTSEMTMPSGQGVTTSETLAASQHPQLSHVTHCSAESVPHPMSHAVAGQRDNAGVDPYESLRSCTSSLKGADTLSIACALSALDLSTQADRCSTACWSVPPTGERVEETSVSGSVFSYENGLVECCEGGGLATRPDGGNPETRTVVLDPCQTTAAVSVHAAHRAPDVACDGPRMQDDDDDSCSAIISAAAAAETMSLQACESALGTEAPVTAEAVAAPGDLEQADTSHHKGETLTGGDVVQQTPASLGGQSVSQSFEGAPSVGAEGKYPEMETCEAVDLTADDGGTQSQIVTDKSDDDQSNAYPSAASGENGNGLDEKGRSPPLVPREEGLCNVNTEETPSEPLCGVSDPEPALSPVLTEGEAGRNSHTECCMRTEGEAGRNIHSECSILRVWNNRPEEGERVQAVHRGAGMNSPVLFQEIVSDESDDTIPLSPAIKMLNDDIDGYGSEPFSCGSSNAANQNGASEDKDSKLSVSDAVENDRNSSVAPSSNEDSSMAIIPDASTSADVEGDDVGMDQRQPPLCSASPAEEESLMTANILLSLASSAEPKGVCERTTVVASAEETGSQSATELPSSPRGEMGETGGSNNGGTEDKTPCLSDSTRAIQETKPSEKREERRREEQQTEGDVTRASKAGYDAVDSYDGSTDVGNGDVDPAIDEDTADADVDDDVSNDVKSDIGDADLGDDVKNLQGYVGDAKHGDNVNIDVRDDVGKPDPDDVNTDVRDDVGKADLDDVSTNGKRYIGDADVGDDVHNKVEGDVEKADLVDDVNNYGKGNVRDADLGDVNNDVHDDNRVGADELGDDDSAVDNDSSCDAGKYRVDSAAASHEVGDERGNDDNANGSIAGASGVTATVGDAGDDDDSADDNKAGVHVGDDTVGHDGVDVTIDNDRVDDDDPVGHDAVEDDIANEDFVHLQHDVTSEVTRRSADSVLTGEGARPEAAAGEIPTSSDHTYCTTSQAATAPSCAPLYSSNGEILKTASGGTVHDSCGSPGGVSSEDSSHCSVPREGGDSNESSHGGSHQADRNSEDGGNSAQDSVTLSDGSRNCASSTGVDETREECFKEKECAGDADEMDGKSSGAITEETLKEDAASGEEQRQTASPGGDSASRFLPPAASADVDRDPSPRPTEPPVTEPDPRGLPTVPSATNQGASSTATAAKDELLPASESSGENSGLVIINTFSLASEFWSSLGTPSCDDNGGPGLDSSASSVTGPQVEAEPPLDSSLWKSKSYYSFKGEEYLLLCRPRTSPPHSHELETDSGSSLALPLGSQLTESDTSNVLHIKEEMPAECPPCLDTSGLEAESREVLPPIVVEEEEPLVVKEEPITISDDEGVPSTSAYRSRLSFIEQDEDTSWSEELPVLTLKRRTKKFSVFAKNLPKPRVCAHREGVERLKKRKSPVPSGPDTSGTKIHKTKRLLAKKQTESSEKRDLQTGTRSHGEHDRDVHLQNRGQTSKIATKKQTEEVRNKCKPKERSPQRHNSMEGVKNIGDRAGERRSKMLKKDSHKVSSLATQKPRDSHSHLSESGSKAKDKIAARASKDSTKHTERPKKSGLRKSTRCETSPDDIQGGKPVDDHPCAGSPTHSAQENFFDVGEDDYQTSHHDSEAAAAPAILHDGGQLGNRFEMASALIAQNNRTDPKAEEKTVPGRAPNSSIVSFSKPDRLTSRAALDDQARAPCVGHDGQEGDADISETGMTHGATRATGGVKSATAASAEGGPREPHSRPQEGKTASAGVTPSTPEKPQTATTRSTSGTCVEVVATGCASVTQKENPGLGEQGLSGSGKLDGNLDSGSSQTSSSRKPAADAPDETAKSLKKKTRAAESSKEKAAQGLSTCTERSDNDQLPKLGDRRGNGARPAERPVPEGNAHQGKASGSSQRTPASEAGLHRLLLATKYPRDLRLSPRLGSTVKVPLDSALRARRTKPYTTFGGMPKKLDAWSLWQKNKATADAGQSKATSCSTNKLGASSVSAQKSSLPAVAGQGSDKANIGGTASTGDVFKKPGERCSIRSEKTSTDALHKRKLASTSQSSMTGTKLSASVQQTARDKPTGRPLKATDKPPTTCNALPGKGNQQRPVESTAAGLKAKKGTDKISANVRLPDAAEAAHKNLPTVTGAPQGTKTPSTAKHSGQGGQKTRDDGAVEKCSVAQGAESGNKKPGTEVTSQEPRPTRSAEESRKSAGERTVGSNSSRVVSSSLRNTAPDSVSEAGRQEKSKSAGGKDKSSRSEARASVRGNAVDLAARSKSTARQTDSRATSAEPRPASAASAPEPETHSVEPTTCGASECTRSTSSSTSVPTATRPPARRKTSDPSDASDTRRRPPVAADAGEYGFVPTEASRSSASTEAKKSSAPLAAKSMEISHGHPREMSSTGAELTGNVGDEPRPRTEVPRQTFSSHEAFVDSTPQWKQGTVTDLSSGNKPSHEGKRNEASMIVRRTNHYTSGVGETPAESGKVHRAPTKARSKSVDIARSAVEISAARNVLDAMSTPASSNPMTQQPVESEKMSDHTRDYNSSSRKPHTDWSQMPPVQRTEDAWNQRPLTSINSNNGPLLSYHTSSSREAEPTESYYTSASVDVGRRAEERNIEEFLHNIRTALPPCGTMGNAAAAPSSEDVSARPQTSSSAQLRAGTRTRERSRSSEDHSRRQDFNTGVAEDPQASVFRNSGFHPADDPGYFPATAADLETAWAAPCGGSRVLPGRQRSSVRQQDVVKVDRNGRRYLLETPPDQDPGTGASACPPVPPAGISSRDPRLKSASYASILSSSHSSAKTGHISSCKSTRGDLGTLGHAGAPPMAREAASQEPSRYPRALPLGTASDRGRSSSSGRPPSRSPWDIYSDLSDDTEVEDEPRGRRRRQSPSPPRASCARSHHESRREAATRSVLSTSSAGVSRNSGGSCTGGQGTDRVPGLCRSASQDRRLAARCGLVSGSETQGTARNAGASSSSSTTPAKESSQRSMSSRISEEERRHRPAGQTGGEVGTGKPKVQVETHPTMSRVQGTDSTIDDARPRDSGQDFASGRIPVVIQRFGTNCSQGAPASASKSSHASRANFTTESMRKKSELGGVESIPHKSAKADNRRSASRDACQVDRSRAEQNGLEAAISSSKKRDQPCSGFSSHEVNFKASRGNNAKRQVSSSSFSAEIVAEASNSLPREAGSGKGQVCRERGQLTAAEPRSHRKSTSEENSSSDSTLKTGDKRDSTAGLPEKPATVISQGAEEVATSSQVQSDTAPFGSSAASRKVTDDAKSVSSKPGQLENERNGETSQTMAHSGNESSWTACWDFSGKVGRLLRDRSKPRVYERLWNKSREEESQSSSDVPSVVFLHRPVSEDEYDDTWLTNITEDHLNSIPKGVFGKNQTTNCPKINENFEKRETSGTMTTEKPAGGKDHDRNDTSSIKNTVQGRQAKDGEVPAITKPESTSHMASGNPSTGVACAEENVCIRGTGSLTLTNDWNKDTLCRDANKNSGEISKDSQQGQDPPGQGQTTFTNTSSKGKLCQGVNFEETLKTPQQISNQPCRGGPSGENETPLLHSLKESTSIKGLTQAEREDEEIHMEISSEERAGVPHQAITTASVSRENFAKQSSANDPRTERRGHPSLDAGLLKRSEKTRENNEISLMRASSLSENVNVPGKAPESVPSKAMDKPSLLDCTFVKQVRQSSTRGLESFKVKQTTNPRGNLSRQNSASAGDVEEWRTVSSANIHAEASTSQDTEVTPMKSNEDGETMSETTPCEITTSDVMTPHRGKQPVRDGSKRIVYTGRPAGVETGLAPNEMDLSHPQIMHSIDVCRSRFNTNHGDPRDDQERRTEVLSTVSEEPSSTRPPQRNPQDAAMNLFDRLNGAAMTPLQMHSEGFESDTDIDDNIQARLSIRCMSGGQRASSREENADASVTNGSSRCTRAEETSTMSKLFCANIEAASTDYPDDETNSSKQNNKEQSTRTSSTGPPPVLQRRSLTSREVEGETAIRRPPTGSEVSGVGEGLTAPEEDAARAGDGGVVFKRSDAVCRSLKSFLQRLRPKAAVDDEDPGRSSSAVPGAAGRKNVDGVQSSSKGMSLDFGPDRPRQPAVPKAVTKSGNPVDNSSGSAPNGTNQYSKSANESKRSEDLTGSKKNGEALGNFPESAAPRRPRQQPKDKKTTKKSEDSVHGARVSENTKESASGRCFANSLSSSGSVPVAATGVVLSAVGRETFSGQSVKETSQQRGQGASQETLNAGGKKRRTRSGENDSSASTSEADLIRRAEFVSKQIHKYLRRAARCKRSRNSKCPSRDENIFRPIECPPSDQAAAAKRKGTFSDEANDNSADSRAKTSKKRKLDSGNHVTTPQNSTSARVPGTKKAGRRGKSTQEVSRSQGQSTRDSEQTTTSQPPRAILTESNRPEAVSDDAHAVQEVVEIDDGLPDSLPVESQGHDVPDMELPRIARIEPVAEPTFRGFRYTRNVSHILRSSHRVCKVFADSTELPNDQTSTALLAQGDGGMSEKTGPAVSVTSLAQPYTWTALGFTGPLESGKFPTGGNPAAFQLGDTPSDSHFAFSERSISEEIQACLLYEEMLARGAGETRTDGVVGDDGDVRASQTASACVAKAGASNCCSADAVSLAPSTSDSSFVVPVSVGDPIYNSTHPIPSPSTGSCGDWLKEAERREHLNLALLQKSMAASRQRLAEDSAGHGNSTVSTGSAQETNAVVTVKQEEGSGTAAAAAAADSGMLNRTGAKHSRTLSSTLSAMFACDICGREFKNPQNLGSHRRIHTAARPCRCLVCLKDFMFPAQLQMHAKTHTKEKEFRCDICGKSFCRNSVLKVHRILHSAEKPFQCAECGGRFQLKQYLRLHMEGVHWKVKKHTCPYCGKRFHQKTGLRTHMGRHRGERPYGCEHCGHGFADLATLKKHLLTHTSRKPFACRQCGARFRQRSGLVSHELTHTDHRPWTCESCGACFRQKAHLHAHRATHLLVQPFACSACQRQFARRCRYTQHVAHCPRYRAMTSVQETLDPSGAAQDAVGLTGV